ncbi:MAG: SNF2-related protein [Patescibacteria group bacterium]|nr:SNF2-related protein [Patescibacteria group bacterium]MDD4610476.1 SNF2-related protein [Patescibacteria group bacterium]
MDISKLPFQAKTLKRATSLDKYNLYRAALEWDLVEPIVIEDREDMHSESKWRDRVEPYHHQVTNLITFCRRLPVTLLADDVGLGKTISAGLVISELISRSRISKILVICPKILREQWKEELNIKFDIPSIIVTGKELVTAELPENNGVVITTYNTARLYLDKIKQNSYDMLILDEAHKLRNLYGVDPTPQVAQRFRKALSDRLFKYVLMLTATPIQNRLWDLYSLVDLLTIARGHENPFGSEGTFARKFIADSRTQARQLKPEMRDEFRSIVYGYMSRVRRGDANLHFPERKVLLHKVAPTESELQLFKIIAGPIQKLNYLAQIVILQALVSSPEALVKLLEGMANKGTAPQSFANEVKKISKNIHTTTKLYGLSTLIDKLKIEQPDTWRVVIFTRWRETQVTIQNFFENQKISCGLINGDSSTKNQETISKFKKDLPDVHVIISTEAGSEGINLQAANVLVNYDLPWNPMIVEQRIGRIQRLSSSFANVSIFNIVLQNTFEEYIVGRLMEKLQLASHAIGDIEALLEASGVDEGEENGSSGFEEKIRQLVVASLAGKDIEQATRKAEKSIADAKTVLEHEEKNINTMLGGMGDVQDSSPRCPKLPQTLKSMDARGFVLAALADLGAELIHQTNGLYISKLKGKRELIRFDNNHLSDRGESTLYAPGTASFDRLVRKITNTGLHQVEDNDHEPLSHAENITIKWLESFEATLKTLNILSVARCFTGKALMRVRATVAHDSYERLVEVACDPSEHFNLVSKIGLEPIGDQIENPTSIGALSKKLSEKASQDSNILDFCRFYTERREQEIISAGSDLRRRKKLEDEFTPRLEISLVGLEGKVYRELKTEAIYKFDSHDEYKSLLTITPSSGVIIGPIMGKCMRTGKEVPEDCLHRCEISKIVVLKHLLIQSEISDRFALPDYIVLCAFSHKKVLEDEAERSAITGELIAKKFLKISSLSGKRAEPTYFTTCEFTKSDVLENEVAVSQVSGKKYRIDEQLKSVVSGKTGHKQEFIFCSETNQPLLLTEAEKCEVTGKIVMPGLLQNCEVTGKKVLPSELNKSSVTGRIALKKFFVSSSISGARLLEEEAVRSMSGKFCVPMEARSCQWSGRKCHPEDLRTCELTGISVHSEYTTIELPSRLEALNGLLNGTINKIDKIELWDKIANYASTLLKGGKFRVEHAVLSPNGKKLAAVLEVRTWIGFKIRYMGLIYLLQDNINIGYVISGKRGDKGWIKF